VRLGDDGSPGPRGSLRGDRSPLTAALRIVSQLYGLLNRLQDLGVELVSVNSVAKTDDAA
jgi:hypothetical protein